MERLKTRTPMAFDVKEIKINLYKEYNYSNICVEIHHNQTGLETKCGRYRSIAMNRIVAEEELEELVERYRKQKENLLESI